MRSTSAIRCLWVWITFFGYHEACNNTNPPICLGTHTYRHRRAKSFACNSANSADRKQIARNSRATRQTEANAHSQTHEMPSNARTIREKFANKLKLQTKSSEKTTPLIPDQIAAITVPRDDFGVQYVCSMFGVFSISPRVSLAMMR